MGLAILATRWGGAETIRIQRGHLSTIRSCRTGTPNFVKLKKEGERKQNKMLRMKYALAQVNRSHGRSKLRFKDNKRTIMVDESWFHLTSDAVTVMLIEDMDVLIHPKVQHKSHIEKIMFLAVLGQPQGRCQANLHSLR